MTGQYAFKYNTVKVQGDCGKCQVEWAGSFTTYISATWNEMIGGFEHQVVVVAELERHFEE